MKSLFKIQGSPASCKATVDLYSIIYIRNCDSVLAEAKEETTELPLSF